MVFIFVLKSGNLVQPVKHGRIFKQVLLLCFAQKITDSCLQNVGQLFCSIDGRGHLVAFIPADHLDAIKEL